MTSPVVLSIQVGQPADYGRPGASEPMDRPWTTSFVKSPVAGPLVLGLTNLEGDAQADLVHHGGPDKAVLCYSAHHYPSWWRELDRPGLAPGDFGENFTILGLTEANVCIGDLWRVGDALTQISQPRQPCWKLARRWRIKDLALQVQQTGRTGWYLRVLVPGTVAAGLPFTLEERPFPDWTVERANRVMHVDKHDRALAASLASVPPLSASWKSTLSLRAERGLQPEPIRRLSGPET